MKKIKSITLLLLVFSLSISVSLTSAVENSWLQKTSMSTARFSFGVATLNGKIYAIGGALDTDSGEITSANEEYDPTTDLWTTKAAMPTPRYGCAVAAYQNKIYVFGGATNSGSYTNATEVYDPATNSWTTKTAMPTARILLDANVVDNKIYLIGGYGNQTANEAYDPETDSWTTKTSTPSPVVAYASAVVDNKIYVIRGTSTNSTQIYDPQTGTWSLGASIPVGVSGAGAATVTYAESTKAIYVVGGETDIFSPQNLTQVYFPENNSWTFDASLPVPTSRLCVAVVDNALYAIGGTRAIIHQGLTDNISYAPSSIIPEFGSWIILPFALLTTFIIVLCKRKLTQTTH